MELGIDIGSYFDEKADHAKYFINGKEVDPILVFKNNGISYARMRLWVDPYDENGKPYGGGTNDLKRVIELSKLITILSAKLLSACSEKPRLSIPSNGWKSTNTPPKSNIIVSIN